MPSTPTTATAEGPLNPSGAPLTGRQAADLLPAVRLWLRRTASSWPGSHAADALRLLDYLCQQEEAPSWAGASALKEAERRIANLEEANRLEQVTSNEAERLRDLAKAENEKLRVEVESLRRSVVRSEGNLRLSADRLVIAAQAAQDFQKERDIVAARLVEAERQRVGAEKERSRLAVEVDKAAKAWKRFCGFDWAGGISDAMKALISQVEGAQWRKQSEDMARRMPFDGVPVGETKAMPACDCEMCRERRKEDEEKKRKALLDRMTKNLRDCQPGPAIPDVTCWAFDAPPAPGTVWLAHLPGIGWRAL